ncbi:TPA: hypothetical protein ACH3X1_002616 [Trebouxia sp. C0004]
MEEYGPKRFIALVTDTARSMLNMRRLPVQKYPHPIEAIQSDDASLADVMRYWHFLARSMDSIKPQLQILPSRSIA